MKTFQPLEPAVPKPSNLWKIVCFCLCLLAVAHSFAAELPKMTGPLKRLGSVEMDVATKIIVATGFVEQSSGVLDYLACGLNGRRYEGVLTLELNAIDLQTALLLAGAKAGKPMTSRHGDPPAGTSVQIWVEWETNGVKKVVDGDELIWNHKDNKPIKTDWIFTGSRVMDGRFAASEDENFLAVRWDPNSIVNIADELGKSYGDVFVNRKVVPETNTPVRVYFKAK